MLSALKGPYVFTTRLPRSAGLRSRFTLLNAASSSPPPEDSTGQAEDTEKFDYFTCREILADETYHATSWQ